MKRLLAIFLALLFSVLAGSAWATAGRDPYVYFFNETWGDYSEEIVKAKEEGKKGVLLFFEMDECPFCHRMKTTVLNQPEVQEYFRKHFLLFSVDIEGDVDVVTFKGESMSQKDFSFKVNRVRATPVFAFYDLQGDQVVRYTGATRGVEEFMWLGEFVAKGLYKDMPFARYKRQRMKEARTTR
jgi:thioredoxin-related protein